MQEVLPQTQSPFWKAVPLQSPAVQQLVRGMQAEPQALYPLTQVKAQSISFAAQVAVPFCGAGQDMVTGAGQFPFPSQTADCVTTPFVQLVTRHETKEPG